MNICVYHKVCGAIQVIDQMVLSLQEPTKRRAKDFLPVVLDDCAVSNDDLIKIPIKYPFQRRAHASAIGNGRPIKSCESATWVRADYQKAQEFVDGSDLRAAMEKTGVVDKPDIYHLA